MDQIRKLKNTLKNDKISPRVKERIEKTIAKLEKLNKIKSNTKSNIINYETIEKNTIKSNLDNDKSINKCIDEYDYEEINTRFDVKIDEDKIKVE